MLKRTIKWLAVGLVIFTCLYYANFMRQSRKPVALALETASKSPIVGNSLGGNLRKTFVTGFIISGTDYGNADLSIHVIGVNGRGALLEWAQNGMGGWHICSLILRTDKPSSDITLVSDEQAHCERE